MKRTAQSQTGAGSARERLERAEADETEIIMEEAGKREPDRNERRRPKSIGGGWCQCGFYFRWDAPWVCIVCLPTGRYAGGGYIEANGQSYRRVYRALKTVNSARA